MPEQGSESVLPGDNVWLVIFAYFFALLPWAFLYAHDFISDKWRTISHTRRAGKCHIVVLLIPLPLIIAYTVLQARAKDFKEMAMGVTAVAFTLYHLARTLWGLWQIRCFAEWALQACKSFHALGYQMQEFDLRAENWGSFPLKFKNEQESVDAMYINSSIVDNEIFGGDAVPFAIMVSGRCWAPIRTFMHRKARELSESKTDGTLSKWALSLVAGLMYKRLPPSEHPPVFGRRNRITVEDIADSIGQNDARTPMEGLGVRGQGYMSCLGGRTRATYEKGPLRLQMYPKDPEDTWVRWCVAYISQRAVRWKDDCRETPPTFESLKHSDFILTFVRLQNVLPLQFWRRFSSHAFDPDKFVNTRYATVWATKFSLRHAILESVFEAGEGLPVSYPSPLTFDDNCMFNFQSQYLIARSLSGARQKDGLLGEGLTPAQLQLFSIITSITDWPNKTLLPHYDNSYGEVLLSALGYAPRCSIFEVRTNVRFDNWVSLRHGLIKSMSTEGYSLTKARDTGFRFGGHQMKILWASLLRSCPSDNDRLQRPIPRKVVQFREIHKFGPSEALYSEISYFSSDTGEGDKGECVPVYIKLRILEECQNSLLPIQDGYVGGVSGSDIRAVLSCILAYPCLKADSSFVSSKHLNADEPRGEPEQLTELPDVEAGGRVQQHSRHEKRVRDRSLLLRVSSMLAPENICIEIQCDVTEGLAWSNEYRAEVRLAKCDGSSRELGDDNLIKFDWQVWKDEFVRAVSATPRMVFSDVTASVTLQLGLGGVRVNQNYLRRSTLRMIGEKVIKGEQVDASQYWRGWELW